MNLNKLASTIHKANKKWWQDIDTGEPIKRNKGELLALIHSEVSEQFEGELHDLMDDKLPHRKMGEVESVDGLIRAFDYCKGFGYDLKDSGAAMGITEFFDLNGIYSQLSMDLVAPMLLSMSEHGLNHVHYCISKVLELERKSICMGVPDAMVNLIAAICIYAKIKGYDMQGAFDEKVAFNANREDHKHEARKIAGGKQF